MFVTFFFPFFLFMLLLPVFLVNKDFQFRLPASGLCLEKHVCSSFWSDLLNCSVTVILTSTTCQML